MNWADRVMGRVRPAPEGQLDAQTRDDARKARRGFMGKALAMGAGATAIPAARAAASVVGDGDPAILNLPEHSKGLGQPVAALGYGMPSKHEKNLQRRESPGLTRVSQASVSFCPLQGLFGIITPNGLHFERHHQGWWDVDPAQHRLMINGLVKQARVFTMDDLMRLPTVSRIHFIECGANTGIEWANVALPSVQYTHGMLSCCEYTGVKLSTLLDMCGADLKQGQYVLAEGADGSSMTRTIPMKNALDDVLVAWGMNGEMLRPENGYPLRLVVPGVQGVSWVKYLRRLEVGDQPYGTKDEDHPLHRPDAGRPAPPVHQHVQECKSGRHHALGRTGAAGQGLLPRSAGLAWSGRGQA